MSTPDMESMVQAMAADFREHSRDMLVRSKQLATVVFLWFDERFDVESDPAMVAAAIVENGLRIPVPPEIADQARAEAGMPRARVTGMQLLGPPGGVNGPWVIIIPVPFFEPEDKERLGRCLKGLCQATERDTLVGVQLISEAWVRWHGDAERQEVALAHFETRQGAHATYLAPITRKNSGTPAETLEVGEYVAPALDPNDIQDPAKADIFSHLFGPPPTRH